MRRLTASKLELAEACPPSHTLDWIEEESDGYAARGTGIHDGLEQVPEVGLEAALSALTPACRRAVERAALTPAVAPLLVKGAASQEVALEWHPDDDRSRALGRGRGAYTNARPGAIVGTADVLAVTDDRVIIADWKSGFHAVTNPRRNLQLRFLALAACRAFGRDAATVSIIYVRDEDDACVVSAELDCLDLAGVADQMRHLIERIATVEHADATTYKRGEHCHRCPAREFCPAWIGLVRWVTKDLDAFKAETGMAISAGAIEAAYRLANEATDAAGMVLHQIKRIAYGTPIPLGDGKYLAYALGNETVASAELVKEVLAREVGPDVAELAISIETVTSSNKGLIEKALKTLPVKARDPVWGALRKEGALTRKAGVRVAKADDIVSPPAPAAAPPSAAAPQEVAK